MKRIVRSGNGGGEGLERRYVAGRGHHEIRLLAVGFGSGPAPYPDPRLAMQSGLARVEPLRRRLLARDDDIDAVVGLQAVVGDPQQTIGVRGQIDGRDIGFLLGTWSMKPGSW